MGHPRPDYEGIKRDWLEAEKTGETKEDFLLRNKLSYTTLYRALKGQGYLPRSRQFAKSISNGFHQFSPTTEARINITFEGITLSVAERRYGKFKDRFRSD